MELKFRLLTLDDVPAIRTLSDSMDMRNDPKIGETAERIINDPVCDLYGAFAEGILVGVGGLRMLTSQYAWIEDVRVHGEYQRMGVGTGIFNYGEELARKKNCTLVAYQTVTENKGSCRIGENLGFKRSHEMTAFYIRQERAPAQEKDTSTLEPLPPEEALSLLKKMPRAPTEEICIGWAYRPLVASIFDDNPDMNFFVVKDTLALEVRGRGVTAGDIQYVNVIIYGNEENVLPLLEEMRRRNRNTEWIFCLVPGPLVSVLEGTDFTYGRVWNGEKNIVALFKKHL
ncbi:MAG: GNAT family N-acetyltransferase [Theionarchaea archaeon]|nr:GNAT family N-acetyltransferase [Theionarchaea archaeon]MBU6999605.1 GNAT family N-acetyltransferase [Theionarchaea archaeon]MBU7020391.1 GNAT family N-acetyltransferase [Theionarchaea archaeon]MBU7035481.1 GNAT family N-acetyltransferase [Theionarchaea archaeon]